MKRIYLLLFTLPFILWACPAKDKNPPPTPVVVPTPKVCFTISKTLFDSGETIAFTNCSVNAGVWLWNLGDGASSQSTLKEPTHVYSPNRTTYHITCRAYSPDQSKFDDTAANIIEGFRQIDSVRINSIDAPTFIPNKDYLFQIGHGVDPSEFSVIKTAVTGLPTTFNLVSNNIKLIHGQNDNSWRGRIISQPPGTYNISFGSSSMIFLSRGLNNSPIHIVDNGVNMDVYYHLIAK